MNNLVQKLVATAALLLPVAAMAYTNPTIDIMKTGTLYGYPQTFNPDPVWWSNEFQVGPVAQSYQLSDGSSWNSGAGSFHTVWSTVQSVEVDHGKLRYTFVQPSDGLLFSNTDFSWGDHSAQGTLGAPAALVMEAVAGSNVGVIKGYTTILSNDATWYGEPLFNYYSAKVGQSVYFETTVTLTDATFTQDLFTKTFEYNESGYVDFTNVLAVPEPSEAAMLMAGMFAIALVKRRKQSRDAT